MKELKLISVSQAAAIARVSRQTIYNAIRDFRLIPWDIGGHVFIEASAAKRFRKGVPGVKKA